MQVIIIQSLKALSYIVFKEKPTLMFRHRQQDKCHSISWLIRVRKKGNREGQDKLYLSKEKLTDTHKHTHTQTHTHTHMEMVVYN